MKLTGNVWKLGDDTGATDIVSAKYDKQAMSHQWDECAKHVLEEILPEFPSKVQPGDLIVAGQNFGTGHAHYYMSAIKGAKVAGAGAFLAESINGLFQRAAIDEGFPAWSFKGLAAMVKTGDRLEIDLATGEASNLTTGESARFKPIAPVILDILDAGGSTNWGLRRVGAAAA